MKGLLYLGLALALVGLALGRLSPRWGLAPASHDLVMAEGDRAEVDGSLVLYLDKFEVLRYPSGKIRQYVSTVKILDRETQSLASSELSVNHPLRVGGWWIYQFGYGPDETDSLCTQLRCVKDRGLPLSALGGLLILLGALGLAVRSLRMRSADISTAASPPSRPKRVASWVAAVVTVCLPFFIIGRAVMRPEPVPALQSWLMAPHVAAYASSYLLLLFAAFGIGRRFVPVGFFLMTLGLVLGAVWGKFAWSEWWQFDPKENWSFVTWLAFLAALHCRPGSRATTWLLRLGAVLILITLTWVNFSKYFTGLHSYA